MPPFVMTVGKKALKSAMSFGDNFELSTTLMTTWRLKSSILQHNKIT